MTFSRTELVSSYSLLYNDLSYSPVMTTALITQPPPHDCRTHTKLAAALPVHESCTPTLILCTGAPGSLDDRLWVGGRLLWPAEKVGFGLPTFLVLGTELSFRCSRTCVRDHLEERNNKAMNDTELLFNVHLFYLTNGI